MATAKASTRDRLCRVLAATLLVALPVAAAPEAVPGRRASDAGPTLEEILERLGGVAEAYVGHALEFSCIEVLHWRTFDAGGRTVDRQGKHRSNYLFSKGDGASLEEIRAPKDLQRMEDIEAHQQSSTVPLYVERAYFWILLFHPDRRERYRYTLEERLQHEGRPAARLRFEPVSPIVPRVNEWYGTALVDLETFQLLQAEGVTAENHDLLEWFTSLVRSPEELPAELDARTVVVTQVSTDFGEQLHGVRLPSEVRVAKTLHRVRGELGDRRVRNVPIHEVRQVYKDCRFYDVSAKVEPPSESVAPTAEDAGESAKSTEVDADEAAASDPHGPVARGWVERFDLPPEDPDVVFDLEELGFLLGAERPNSWEGGVTDGTYRLSNPWRAGEIYVQPISALGGEAAATLSGRVRVLKDVTDARLSGAGLLYRYDPLHREYYALLLTADAHVRFQRRTREGFVTLFSLGLERLEPRFYTLEVRGEGATFHLALDGRPLGSVQDDELPGGLSGIIAIARGSFAFDELTMAPAP